MQIKIYILFDSTSRLIKTHTAGCGVPDTTPAPENNVAVCPGGQKKKKKKKKKITQLFNILSHRQKL